MKYEKPEMELVVFEQNVHMTLSLVPGVNDEGNDDGKDKEINW